MDKEKELARMQELSIEMYKIAKRLIEEERKLPERKAESLTPIEKLDPVGSFN